jgi:tetratricopeptide (TPR) repeat protein
MRIAIILAIILLVSGVSTLFAGEPDAQELIENGHFKRARDVAEALYRTHPQDARAAYLLAEVRNAFGDYEEALKYAEQAVRLDPKNAEYHRELADVYGNIGLKSSLFKQYSLAKKCRAELDTASAMNPIDIENLDAQMTYYLEAPGIVGGDKKKALAIAMEITKLNPARGYMAQAQIAKSEKGNDSSLEQLYKKALESDPRNYLALVSLSNYYLMDQHANYGQAENYAREAIEMNSDRIGAYCARVQALVKQGRQQEVSPILAKAEGAVPDNLAPYIMAGRALLQQGVDFETAETYLRKYLTQAPEPGWPPHAGALWSLGLLFEKRGDKPRARSQMEAALRSKPDYEPAKKDLKRLK